MLETLIMLFLSFRGVANGATAVSHLVSLEASLIWLNLAMANRSAMSCGDWHRSFNLLERHMGFISLCHLLVLSMRIRRFELLRQGDRRPLRRYQIT